MKFRIVTIALCILLSSCMTYKNSNAPKSFTVDLLRYGPVETNIYGEAESDVDTVYLVGETRIIEETDTIKIYKGLKFGIVYKIIPKDLNANYTIEEKSYYPGDGISIDSVEQKIKKSETYLFESYGIHEAFAGYFIEEDNEIVKGDWRYEIWVNGVCYLTKVFTLQ